MSALQWFGLLAAGVAVLFVVAVIGLVRICLEVEQGAAEESPGSPLRDARSPTMRHSRSPS